MLNQGDIVDFDQKTFCRNLTELRKAKGYNKYEMSIQSDIHYTYYLDIENGNRLPNFRGLVSIANALNTDIAHLTGTKEFSKTDTIKKDILSKLQKVKDDEFLERLLNVLISIRIWNDDNEGL